MLKELEDPVCSPGETVCGGQTGKTGASAGRRDHHVMLGMRLDYLEIETFIDAFAASAKRGEAIYGVVPDVYQCVFCHDNENHRRVVNGADFVFSDSVVLQTARALRYGVRAIRTIRGSEMMLALCEEAQEREIPIALIGGRDEDVLEKIKSSLVERFPRLRIAYAFSPPFRGLTPAEEAAMLEALNHSGARLVFVGIGCPKQEQWMGRYTGRVDAAMIGVGAAFDTIGGLVQPSPAFIHRIGLDWLFRLMREPRRLYRRYLVSAPRFIWLMLRDWASNGFSRKATKRDVARNLHQN